MYLKRHGKCACVTSLTVTMAGHNLLPLRLGIRTKIMFKYFIVLYCKQYLQRLGFKARFTGMTSLE